MKNIMLAGVAISVLMAASAPAHAGNNGLSHIGVIYAWLAGKSNLDGTLVTTSNGKDNRNRQDADNWEAKLGSNYVDGVGAVPSKTAVFLDKNYEAIKAGISTGVKFVVTTAATPLMSKPAAQMLGSNWAAATVALGESSAQADNGKDVSVVGAVATAVATTTAGEIIAKVVPSNNSKRTEDVAKVIVKAGVKTAVDAVVAIKNGQKPGKSIDGNIAKAAVDVALTTVGFEGGTKDAVKVYVNGAIKVLTTKDKIERPGEVVLAQLPASKLPDGGYTPNGAPGGYTPGPSKNGHDGDTTSKFGGKSYEGGVSREDTHQAGGGTSHSGDGDNGNRGGDDGDGNGGTDDTNAEGATVDSYASDGTAVKVEYSAETSLNTNPEEGGNSGHDAAKLEQMGIHIGGWGRNDGDSTGGTSNSASTGSANHAGGGTDLYEPSYDTIGNVGKVASAGGSTGEGMGDGNASEGGKGAGQGGGIRSHGAIGGNYSGNTADGSGWGGLDHLPMAQGSPTMSQLSAGGLATAP